MITVVPRLAEETIIRKRDIARQTFLERYPDVDPEDVDRLLQSRRRWRYAAYGLIAFVVVVLSATAFAAVRLQRVATTDAPAIANEIAAERYGAIQIRVDERTAEARQLIGEFFLLLGDTLEQNPTVRQLEREWRTASSNASLLLTDVANLRETPRSAGKSLWETGRERIDAIISAAAQMIIAIQNFVPNAVAALDGARTEIRGETTFGQAVDLVEMLLVPVMENDPELVQRWAILRNRIQGWKSVVDSDVEAVRESLRGEAVTDEFFRRIADALF